jgi:hypothetical protein
VSLGPKLRLGPHFPEALLRGIRPSVARSRFRFFGTEYPDYGLRLPALTRRAQGAQLATGAESRSPLALKYPRALLEYPTETVVVSNSEPKCFSRAGPSGSDVELRTESLMRQ